MPVKEVLPDGTRVYTKGHRYRPLELHERKTRRLKPEDAEARGFMHWHGEWLPPLPTIPDSQRRYPETVSELDLVDHIKKCTCKPCRTNPQAEVRKRKAHPEWYAETKKQRRLRRRRERRAAAEALRSG